MNQVSSHTATTEWFAAIRRRFSLKWLALNPLEESGTTVVSISSRHKHETGISSTPTGWFCHFSFCTSAIAVHHHWQNSFIWQTCQQHLQKFRHILIQRCAPRLTTTTKATSRATALVLSKVNFCSSTLLDANSRSLQRVYDSFDRLVVDLCSRSSRTPTPHCRTWRASYYIWGTDESSLQACRNTVNCMMGAQRQFLGSCTYCHPSAILSQQSSTHCQSCLVMLLIQRRFLRSTYNLKLIYSVTRCWRLVRQAPFATPATWHMTRYQGQNAIHPDWKSNGTQRKDVWLGIVLLRQRVTVAGINGPPAVFIWKGKNFHMRL